MYLEIGEKAPQFKLMDQINNEIQLDEFKGSKIVLWFYPKANTPG